MSGIWNQNVRVNGDKNKNIWMHVLVDNYDLETNKTNIIKIVLYKSTT